MEIIFCSLTRNPSDLWEIATVAWIGLTMASGCMTLAHLWKLFSNHWTLKTLAIIPWIPIAACDPHQSRFSVGNALKCLFTATLMKRWINKNEQLSYETIMTRGFTSGQQRIFGNVCGQSKLRSHTRVEMARRKKKVSSFCHTQIFWDASALSRETRVFASRDVLFDCQLHNLRG